MDEISHFNVTKHFGKLKTSISDSYSGTLKFISANHKKQFKTFHISIHWYLKEFNSSCKMKFVYDKTKYNIKGILFSICMENEEDLVVLQNIGV